MRTQILPLRFAFAAVCTIPFASPGCSSGGATANGNELDGKGISSGGGNGGAIAGGDTTRAPGTTKGEGGNANTFQSPTGGTNAIGGVSSDGTRVNGGASSNLGTATGGTIAGGTTATGYKTNGGASSVGASSNGGKATGGVTSAGGKANGGSSSALGGVTSSTIVTGGKPTGGSPTNGGRTAGATTAAGGSSAAGGSTGSPTCVAATAVANMKLGWNLGNSLDSVDSSKSDTTVETAWGNPPISSALIQSVAASGFGAVRIPVTWIGRMGNAPGYTLNATFINRVEEVVNYVLKQGLYAIVNLHHDGGNNVTGRWLTLVDSSGQVSSEHTAAVMTQFKQVWTQIADHFKAYDDHLVFEGMNEVMVDYGTPQQSYYAVVNALNQAFIDTVRATGGNNPNRCLIVPGYNTNIDYTVAGFVAPKDTASGKLILSDHFYDPYDFTGSANTHAWGSGNPGTDSWGQEDWVRTEITKLKSTYVDQGLPVILGEYGAVNQSGYENYRRYYVEYVTKAAHDAGIVPFFWDNGSTGSGSDAFGLINRSNNSVLYPTILEAMVRATTSSYGLADVAKP